MVVAALEEDLLEASLSVDDPTKDQQSRGDIHPRDYVVALVQT